MKITDVDILKVTPMMRQYMEIKLANPDIIIFFRLGDFYEMFFEDAITVSHDLELTLTGKSAGLDERIPMCGVPHHAAEIYIEKLINLGYKVGICEQLEDAKNTKTIVKRGITRIVSKGTIIDESLDEKNNNYIGNVLDLKHAYSLSYIDISTGDVYVKLIEHNISNLINEIVSLNIKEILVPNNFNENILNTLNKQFEITISKSDIIEDIKEYEYIYKDLKDSRLIETLKHMLTYLNITQKRNLSHLKPALFKENKNYLKMDIHTKTNLELTETIRLKTRNNSLIWLLDKTKTAMGARSLKNYLENPLINKLEIEERYNIVETLIKDFMTTQDLRDLLFEVYDIERLSGRIAFGNANARDLIQLKNSIKVLPHIKEILKKIKFKSKFETLDKLYNLLQISINEDAPITIKEGNLIKSNYNNELDELKEIRSGGKDFIAKFELEERNKTGIKSLKVGYNKVFGYYIEISKGNIGLIKDEYGYDRKQTLSNCERYISPILKEKEAMILNAEDRIIDLEYSLFTEIRDEVKKYIPKLQTISKIISEIDVLQSFALVAEENGFIRPIINDKSEIEIIDGRHPVVEKVQNKEYVSNDIIMDENTNILLITGPNMSGKSTYMRQLAIIVILAQIGSFVPAKYAKIPIFDAIYTRIGASDDLVSGESTFMSEMIEANYAITNATKNSLILFDELGRGTATYDGMALAEAIIEYIHNNIGCKMLFSTHYHELTNLEKNLSNLKNIHVSAEEEDGNIIFLHKIKTGSIDKSYGIHVAKLANIPDEVIKKANKILNIYENKKTVKIQEEIEFNDIIIKESIIEKKIKEINPLEITPIEALNILYDLKKDIK